MTNKPKALRLADELESDGIAMHAAAELRSLAAQRDELLDALKDTTAHLVAAVTLLVRGGEQAVADDQMFSQMITDYTKSFKRGMAVIWAAITKAEDGK